MNTAARLSDRAIFFVYTAFIAGSTFSIAVGQVATGLALMLFLVFLGLTRRYPYLGPIKWFYIFCGLYVFWMALAGELARPGIDALDKMREEWLFCIVPIGVMLFQKESRARVMITLFAVGVTFIALYSIGQYFTGWHFFNPGLPVAAYDFGYRIIGNFSHPLTFANFNATAGLFFYGYSMLDDEKLSNRMRWFFRVVAFLAMGVTVLSYSRGPTAAIIATLVLSAIVLRSRTAITGTAILLVVLALVGVKSGVFSRAGQMMSSEVSSQDGLGRVFIWSHSWEIVKEHPIVGVGPGRFKEAYELTLGANASNLPIHGHAHDDLLNVGAQSGFPGAIFFFAMWVSVWYYSWRAFKSATLTSFDRRVALAGFLGAVCFFFTSVTEASFAAESVRQMLMFVWAAGLGMYAKSKSDLAPR